MCVRERDSRGLIGDKQQVMLMSALVVVICEVYGHLTASALPPASGSSVKVNQQKGKHQERESERERENGKRKGPIHAMLNIHR